MKRYAGSLTNIEAENENGDPSSNAGLILLQIKYQGRPALFPWLPTSLNEEKL